MLLEDVLLCSLCWTHSLVFPREMGQVFLPCCMFLQCFSVRAVSAGTYLYPGKSLSSRSVSCLKPKTASLKEGSCSQKQASQSVRSLNLCAKHDFAVQVCYALVHSSYPNPPDEASLLLIPNHCKLPSLCS